MNSPSTDSRLRQFYRSVDEDTRRLQTLHSDRLQCRRGCSACCVDGLTVFVVEADYIRQQDPVWLRNARPHPEGQCAFLDPGGACRIYAHRPYVCRTQGLPLRWITDDQEEMRDICPLNETTEPVETIPIVHCWTIGPREGQLAEIQRSADPGMPRIALRDLFESSRTPR